MKKRLLVMLLALAMGLTLAACSGGEDKKPDSSSSAPTASPSAGGESAAPAESAPAGDESDLAYVKDKGTLVVGITNFEPMDYQDANGQWIGFDADTLTACGTA